MERGAAPHRAYPGHRMLARRFTLAALGLRALIGAAALGGSLASAGCASIAPPKHPVGVLMDAAAPGTPAPAHPRPTKAAFHDGLLYLRAADGSLGVLGFTGGARSGPFSPGGVIDIHRTLDDRLWVLEQREGDVRLWERIEGGFKPILQMAEPSLMLAVSDLDGRPVLLAERALVFVDATGKLQRTLLDRRVERGRVPLLAFAVAEPGVAYVGTNDGEWGGALYRIPLFTGHVDQLPRVDPPGSPRVGWPALNYDPVTGLVQDPALPQCVLAGVGLRHMGMSVGRLLRVCGGVGSVVNIVETGPARTSEVRPSVRDKLAVFFDEIARPPLRVPGEPDPPSDGRGDCETDASACPPVGPWGDPADAEPAVLGLARTRRGFWLLRDDGFLLVGPGGTRRYEIPPLLARAGARVAWVPGAVTALTDANRVASVSGNTPLFAVTSLDEAVSDSARYPTLEALRNDPPGARCFLLDRRRTLPPDPPDPGPERALCFDKTLYHAKDVGGWISGALSWKTTESGAWLGTLSVRESLRVWAAGDRAVVAYLPSLWGRRVGMRRATGAEEASLRQDLARAEGGKTPPR